MSRLVRMPYTNAWRMGRIHHDCFSCTVCRTYPINSESQNCDYELWKSSSLLTCLICLLFTQVPASSGSKGIKISDMLEAAGKSVIGWDIEWPVNWSTNRLKIGGAAMYGKMNSRHTKVNVFAITNLMTILKSLKKYFDINFNLLIYYSHQEK